MAQNDTFVALGHDPDEPFPLVAAYLSDDGIEWTKGRNFPIEPQAAHAAANNGIYMAADYRGANNSVVHLSQNGSDWRTIQGVAFASHPGRAPGGFAAVGFEGYRLSPDGENWVEYPSPFPDASVRKTVLVGETLYLLSEFDIFARSTSDVAVFDPNIEPAQYGIGDRITITATVSRTDIDLDLYESLEIGVYFSRDSFFGNDDDQFQANLRLSEAIGPDPTKLSFVLNVGREAVAGDFYVALKLDHSEKLFELNEANNIALTEGPVVQIPEWELQVESTGTGSIDQSVFSIRYVHQSNVSLVAKPAKSSAFGGWSGDNLGGLNQITVQMNQDKVVSAGFLEAHRIQVRTSGLGSIAQPSTSYKSGEVAVLEATPAAGWRFLNWSGDLDGTEPMRSVTVSTSLNVLAAFGQTYEGWARQSFSPSDFADPTVSAPEIDHDGDSLSNQAEFALAADPLNPHSSGIEEIEITGDHIYLRYTLHPGAIGTSVEPQYSTDLSVSIPFGDQRIVEEEGSRIRIEASAQHIDRDTGFVRFKITP